MLTSMSAFDDIAVKQPEEMPVPPENASPETPAVPAPPETPEQPAEIEKVADQGAPTEVKEEPTTEEETQFVLTGHETPEQIQQRGGDMWLVRAGRRSLAVAKEAGGFQNLKNSARLAGHILSSESTGQSLLSEVAKISPTQAQKFVNDIFWDHVDNPELQDATLSRILGSEVSLAGVKQALADVQVPSEDPADEMAGLSPALRQEIEESRSMRQRFPELEREVQGFRSTNEQKAVSDLGKELYGSVFSVVNERKSKLGLEVLPTDSEDVQDIKATLNDLLSDESVEREFEANAENANLSDKAIRFIKKRDRDGAFAYQEPLSVAAEITFENMLRSPRVSRALAQLKSVVEAQSKPKDPTAREEIVAGAKAAVIPVDAFAEGQKEGLSPFEVAQKLAGARVAAH